MIGGAILAILVGICIIGGGKQIVRITGVLVPFMGVFYILMAIAVMILNIGRLPEVFVNIFSNAFDFKAIFGGFAGSAMTQGNQERSVFQRGGCWFCTERGGSSQCQPSG